MNKKQDRSQSYFKTVIRNCFASPRVSVMYSFVVLYKLDWART